jgi:carbonic anhydrase
MEQPESPPAGSGPVPSQLPQVLAANERYAADFGDKAKLVGAPTRRMAILTCMDARMDPARFAGLIEGDAHVIRNAGGRASDDAIRSLIISYKLLGTREWLVIHHSGCGMQSCTDDDIRHLLGLPDGHSHEGTQWQAVSHSAQTPSGDFAEWLTFTDLAQSIISDVERIRNHPLVAPEIAIYGYIYHVHHGRLEAVAEANRIGRPRT